MSRTRRRLSLQLTPLLDLLLIVIFAQYMEVRQKTHAVEENLKARDQQLTQRQQELENTFRSRSAQLESETTQIRSEYEQRFQSILDQQHRAATTIAESLNLPGEIVEQVAKLRKEGNTADAERLEQAADRLKSLMSSRGPELIRFLTRVDEMQKHVTVWEIHIRENGQAVLSDGQQALTISYSTAEEFSQQIFESSKQLAEPKILVLILLTYGDTQAGLRRKATDAMPELVNRLRNDAGQTHWYDFSLMGYRPQGSILNPSAPVPPSPPLR